MSDAPSKALSSASREFGIVIALLIPGFIALWPIQYFSDTVEGWFQGAGVAGAGGVADPSAAGFMLIVLASLALGMLIGAIRWATLDQLHEAKIEKPDLDYSNLEKKLAAYERIQEAHYRYYQYYANTSVALAFWLAGHLVAKLQDAGWKFEEWLDGVVVLWVVGILAVEFILFHAGRDALQNTAKGLTKLLGEVSSEGETG